MTASLVLSNLPNVLSEEDGKNLLSHFHAECIQVFKRGRRKKVIFARFSSVSEARHALLQLHQARIGKTRLVVEYADDNIQLDSLSHDEASSNVSTSTPSDPSCLQRLASFPFPSPALRYSYPPPSVSILARISAALVATPRFYTQVLHLMNKLSLPAPFPAPDEVSVPVPPGSVPVSAPTPPAPAESGANAAGTPPLPPEGVPLPAVARVVKKVDVAVQTEVIESSSESELESSDDGEEPKHRKAKRQRVTTLPDSRRRLRAVRLLQKTAPVAAVPPRLLSEVFDTPSVFTPARAPVLRLPSEQPTPANGPGVELPVQVGFAKMHPSRETPTTELPSVDDTDNSEFVSDRQLAENRISAEGMKALPVFARYTAGEPSARLYIKNLDKRVELADLRRIYGRYIDWNNEEETNAFDVRLMQEGRMKGQAFISLPSPDTAQRALTDTNGYILKDKPMVVQFGRSARPKDAPS